MKIHSVNTYGNKNIGFKSNNTTKLGIGALIVSSSLFMLSNAIDTFDSENIKNTSSINIDTPASMFGILGTFMSLIGLKKDE